VSCCALSGCGSHSGTNLQASDAKRLVLQRGDLPPGYTEIGAGAQNPFTANSVEPKRYGRQGGWYADYRRPPGVTTGALIVQSAVDVFGDSIGAGRELDADRTKLEPDAIPPPPFGDESVAGKVRGAGEPAALVYTIAWRRGNVTSLLVVTGLSGKLTRAEAVRLARRADARPEPDLRAVGRVRRVPRPERVDVRERRRVHRHALPAGGHRSPEPRRRRATLT
jgi:hypothetical protein